MKLCPGCGHYHALDVECAHALKAAIEALIKNLAGPKPGSCKGCGQPIFWLTHANGKKVPYTPQGLNHFVNCPSRDQFKKSKPGPLAGYLEDVG